MTDADIARSRIWNSNVTIALIGIIPAVITAFIGYTQGFQSTAEAKAKAELQSKSILFQGDENPNYRKLTYPNYGISLLAPRSWTVEDGPAAMAGGEFNLIKRYEETKGAIGINFRLRPIQANYVADIQAQIRNQFDVFRRLDESVAIEDAAISGKQAKLFRYKQGTGQRKMDVCMYWIRLAPNVQLQILAAQYDDAADKEEFWRESENVVSSVVIAFDAWEQRYTRYNENGA